MSIEPRTTLNIIKESIKSVQLFLLHNCKISYIWLIKNALKSNTVRWWQLICSKYRTSGCHTWFILCAKNRKGKIKNPPVAIDAFMTNWNEKATTNNVIEVSGWFATIEERNFGEYWNKRHRFCILSFQVLLIR